MKTIIYKKAGKEVRLEKDWSFERIEKVICRARIKECEIINGKFKINVVDNRDKSDQPGNE